MFVKKLPAIASSSSSSDDDDDDDDEDDEGENAGTLVEEPEGLSRMRNDPICPIKKYTMASLRKPGAKASETTFGKAPSLPTLNP